MTEGQQADRELDEADLILIAAHAFYLSKTLPRDEHREEVLRPFVSMLTKPENKKNWLMDTNSLLHRARNDFEKTKTKESSLIYFQGLLDSFRNQGTDVQNKVNYVFAVNYPLRWLLQKELADLYKETGCFVSAFELLNEVELTEDAITCLFLAGRQTQAIKTAEAFL